MNKKSLSMFFMFFSVILSIGSLFCEEIDKEVSFDEDIAVESTIQLSEWAQKQKEKAILFCKKHKKALKIVAGSLVALGGSFGFYHIYNMIFTPIVPNPSQNPVPGGGPKGKEKDISSLSSSSSSSSSSGEEDNNTGLPLGGGPSTNNIDDKGLEGKESEEKDRKPKKEEEIEKRKQEEAIEQARLEQARLDKEKQEKEERERAEIADGKKRDKEDKKEPRKEFYETEYTEWALAHQEELKISFKQLPVLSQFQSNGGGASCGYHALLRGIQLVQILNNGYEKKDYSLLTDPGIIDKFFYKQTFLERCKNLYTWWNNGTKPKKAGIWREEIIKKRAEKKSSNDPDGDWLDDDELRLLWQKSKRLVSGIECQCIVIPNFSVIGHPVEGIDDVTNKINDILAHNEQTKNFSCIFLIGNMKVDVQTGESGSSGHWSSLVYYQDNELNQHFLAMNSKSNEDLLKDPRTLAIVGMVKQFFNRN